MRKLLPLFTFLLCALGLQLNAQCTDGSATGNRCLDFDPNANNGGGPDYVQPVNAPLTLDPNFTIECRFRMPSTNTGTNPRRLLALSGSGNQFQLLEIGGRIHIGRQPVSGTNLTSPVGLTTDLYRDDQWHHVAATRNGVNLAVYIDGVLKWSNAGFSGNLALSLFRVGAPSGTLTNATWQGRIDEVRVWDVPRSLEQINATRNCPLNGNEAGLKLYYKLDQGIAAGNNATVTLATDLAGGDNDGTLQNFLRSGSASNWVCGDADFCACAANFTFTVDNCGKVTFLNTTPLTPPPPFSWNFGDPNSSNNTSTQSSPMHTYATAGTYSVCLTAGTGPSACTTCKTVQVSSVDNQGPSLRCLDISLQFNNGTSGPQTIFPQMFLDGVLTDNCCPDNSLTLNLQGQLVYTCDDVCKEPKQVFLIATDCNGNTSVCQPFVSSFDNDPPVARCKNATVILNANGVATMQPSEVNNGSTDNCGIESSSVNIGNFSCPPPTVPCPFTQTVVLTVTDYCDKSSTCTAQVTVTDNLAPIIQNCPSNISVSVIPGQTSATATWTAPVATDNCPGSILTSSHASGSSFPIGSTVVTYTATDRCNNTATCSFTVTVAGSQNCECGFANMLFNSGPAPQQIICGQSFFSLGCPDGKTYNVTGTFSCLPVGTNCTASGLTWNLVNASNVSVASGTFTSGAFNIPINGTVMNTAGTYTMTISGTCGTNKCTCVVRFVSDGCPPSGDFPGFQCGQAIFGCFSGWTDPNHYWNLLDNDPTPLNGLVKNDVVLALADIRKHIDALPYTNPSSNWASLPPKYMHPDWITSKMGQVFGLAIDGNDNVYVGATALYGQLKPGNLPGAGPGTIYKLNALTGAPSVWANLPNSLTNNGNIRSGLGDLAYDPDHNTLFVSNFHDGRIYRLDMAGTIMQVFDPPLGEPLIPGQGFFDPMSTNSTAKLGQRIWGIGYHNNRLYFGVWVEAQGSVNPTRDNELWSVPLVAGAFSGPINVNSDFYDLAVLERSFPEYEKSPISDLAFSCNDEIIICTKGRADEVYLNFAGYAHNSTVWRIALNNIIGPMQKYYVGQHWMRTNTSGGVDIGYGSFDPSISPVPTVVDDKIWVTGDALVFPNQPTVYGLAGLPFLGNTFTNVVDNSILIDADGSGASVVKTYYGDVEIFKCLACPASVPPECDSISAFVTPVKFFPGQQKKDCCYRLWIDNQVDDFFSSVNIQVIEGATMNIPGDITVNNVDGWSLQSFINGISAEVGHNSGDIPIGQSNPANICLSNISQPEQVLVVQYLNDQGETECSDTIRLKCDYCAYVIRDTIKCGSGSQRTLTFCLDAADNLGYSIESVVFMPPPGITFTPSAFSVSPPLSPTDPCRTFTVAVDLGTTNPNGQLCYGITVHEGDVAAGDPPLRCCMIKACTDLPDCLCDSTRTYATFRPAKPLSDGLCCYDITLNQPPGEFVNVQTELISAGSVFSAVGSGAGWNSSFLSVPKDIWWTPNPVQTLPAIATLPTVCFAGTAPQMLEIAWMTDDSVFCYDQLQFNCSDGDCAIFDSLSMTCNVIGGTAVSFSFNITNNSGQTITHAALVNVTPTGIITGSTVFPLGSLADGATTPTLTTTLNNAAGTQVCFQVNLYYQNPDNKLDIKDCCLTDEMCFTVPRCTLQNFNQPIVFFPNPTRDELTLMFEGGAPANGYLRVRDVSGRLMFEEAVLVGAVSHRAYMEKYPSGLYFVEFVENQRRIWSDKVVRQ